jgi:hypothetical protein
MARSMSWMVFNSIGPTLPLNFYGENSSGPRVCHLIEHWPPLGPEVDLTPHRRSWTQQNTRAQRDKSVRHFLCF